MMLHPDANVEHVRRGRDIRAGIMLFSSSLGLCMLDVKQKQYMQGMTNVLYLSIHPTRAPPIDKGVVVRYVMQ